MQGEMSATVLYYPTEYTRLQRQIKELLLEGHPQEWAPNVKVSPPSRPTQRIRAGLPLHP